MHLQKGVKMGKHCILISSILIFSTVLSFVYHVDAAGSCSDHDKDCSQCRKSKTFHCNFVVKYDNKTATKCLNDEEFHKWSSWNLFEVQEECNDASDKTEEISTSTPNGINVTLIPIEQNNNNSKETNNTSLIKEIVSFLKILQGIFSKMYSIKNT